MLKYVTRVDSRLYTTCLWSRGLTCSMTAESASFHFLPVEELKFLFTIYRTEKSIVCYSTIYLCRHLGCSVLVLSAAAPKTLEPCPLVALQSSLRTWIRRQSSIRDIGGVCNRADKKNKKPKRFLKAYSRNSG